MALECLVAFDAEEEHPPENVFFPMSRISVYSTIRHERTRKKEEIGHGVCNDG
jgi:hypothetical protein